MTLQVTDIKRSKARPCFQCGETSVSKKDRYEIEKLPHNGVLWAVPHDKQICTWAVFYIPAQDFNKRKESQAIFIICPICGKTGRIQSYTPRKKLRSEMLRYYIAHKNSMSEELHCYMTKPEYRRIIIESLGRLPDRN